jgi:hypothetical protein
MLNEVSKKIRPPLSYIPIHKSEVYLFFLISEVHHYVNTYSKTNLTFLDNFRWTFFFFFILVFPLHLLPFIFECINVFMRHILGKIFTGLTPTKKPMNGKRVKIKKARETFWGGRFSGALNK